MAKEPAGRYATAQELADDLRRFLEDRPIRARRPTLLERAAKWARRHTAVVWSAVALLVLAVVGLAAGIVLIDQERRQTERSATGPLGRSRPGAARTTPRIDLAHREIQDDNAGLAESLLVGCPARPPRLGVELCQATGPSRSPHLPRPLSSRGPSASRRLARTVRATVVRGDQPRWHVGRLRDRHALDMAHDTDTGRDPAVGRRDRPRAARLRWPDRDGPGRGDQPRRQAPRRGGRVSTSHRPGAG